MKSKDIKLDIIENYIDWFTHHESVRQDMKDGAAQYVEEDHVDEIHSAGFVPIADLKAIASMLVEDGINIEYTRGVCELLAEIDGIKDVSCGERAYDIAKELGVERKYLKQLYE